MRRFFASIHPGRALAIVALFASLAVNLALLGAYDDQRSRTEIFRGSSQIHRRAADAAWAESLRLASELDDLRRQLAAEADVHARLAGKVQDARDADDLGRVERDEALRQVEVLRETVEVLRAQRDLAEGGRDDLERQARELRESLDVERRAVSRCLDENYEISLAYRDVACRYIELAARHGAPLDGIPGDIVLDSAAAGIRRWAAGMGRALADLSGASFRGVQGPPKPILPPAEPAPADGVAETISRVAAE